jgi:hypothetical protein
VFAGEQEREHGGVAHRGGVRERGVDGVEAQAEVAGDLHRRDDGTRDARADARVVAVASRGGIRG